MQIYNMTLSKIGSAKTSQVTLDYISAFWYAKKGLCQEH